jgi:hypothetical protein
MRLYYRLVFSRTTTWAAIKAYVYILRDNRTAFLDDPPPHVPEFKSIIRYMVMRNISRTREGRPSDRHDNTNIFNDGNTLRPFYCMSKNEIM